MPGPFIFAKSGTLDEFLNVYDGDARAVDRTGLTLLHRALGNRRLDARVAIANRLLDDGADAAALVLPEGYSVLHVLFAQTSHDFIGEGPLLERLLAGGADINARATRWGTPVQTLAGTLKFDDDELAAFYEILFSRPDLDLLAPAGDGISTLETSRRLGEHREHLTALMEQYIQLHTSAPEKL